MHVFDFSPIKLSLNTWVNLLALKGKCVPLRLNARIHSFNANKDLLISAPSIPKNFNHNLSKGENRSESLTCSYSHGVIVNNQVHVYSRVCLLADDVSAPLSLPARSMSENFPCTLCVPGIRAIIWNTACDLEELELALVWPLVLALFPCCINFSTSSQVSTTFSVKPTICTCR